MSGKVYGFCKNKCKQEVLTSKTSPKGEILITTTTDREGKYLKLFEIDIPTINKNHYISFSLADVQSGRYYKEYILNIRKYNSNENIVIADFKEQFSHLKSTDEATLYAVIESNTKVSVWQLINKSNETPILKIISDLHYSTESITITPNVIADTLPTGTSVQPTKDKVVITGSTVLSYSTENTEYQEADKFIKDTVSIDYPTGFTVDNTTVIGVAIGLSNVKYYGDFPFDKKVGIYCEKVEKTVILNSDSIVLNLYTPKEFVTTYNAFNITYEIILMKI